MYRVYISSSDVSHTKAAGLFSRARTSSLPEWTGGLTSAVFVLVRTRTCTARHPKKRHADDVPAKCRWQLGLDWPATLHLRGLNECPFGSHRTRH
ncbi:hypothetical protein V8C44DRAFT_160751 [Trichoderma aethiopicum]